MLHPTFFPLRHLCLAAVSLIAAGLLSQAALAQTSLFNDGTDTGWTRYDPIAVALGQQTGATGSTWTFPGGAYQLKASASPNKNLLGPGRSGSLRSATEYTDFCVSVDILPGWDSVPDQAFGILARIPVSSVGPGTTDGYALTYQTESNDIQISRMTDEDPVEVAQPVAVTLDPAKSYRMVFLGSGSDLKGYIFQLPDIVTPIVAVQGTDATYSAGVCGVVVYDNGGNAGAQATFDNYAASSLATPTLTQSVSGSEISLQWPLSAMHYVLQVSSTLGLNEWADVTDGSVFLNGTDGRQELVTEPTLNHPNRFFRLRPR